MNFIFGSSGFAKEVDWLVNDIYINNGMDFRTDFFVDTDNERIGAELNNKKIISETDFFMKYAKDSNNVIVAIADNGIRKKIVEMITNNTEDSNFPVIVHPSASYDGRDGKISIGKGSIICAGTVITTDIAVGEFVHINIGCTVGHDTIIENYTTLSPCVSISGNVLISKSSFLGTGAIVLPGVMICPDTTIGAGAVVSKNIDVSGTYIGAPARKIR